MKTYKYPQKHSAPTAVALGYFDGVHLAHKAVISAAVNYRLPPLTPAVFTFSDCPGKTHQGVLTTEEEKLLLFENLGVEAVFLAEFESVRDMSAEEFVDRVLVESLSAQEVFCGYNYRFAKNASADTEALSELCSQRGIKVTCLSEIFEEGFSISSTAVRNLLAKGDVSRASRLLGREYSLQGRIIHGNKIGRKLGTPTINIAIPCEKLLPRLGVYAALVSLGEDPTLYPAVLNIGTKPTVSGECSISAEAYLMNTEGDFYGDFAKVKLIEFLRDEEKFASLDALKKAIERDIEKAKQILASTILPLSNS